MSFFPSALDAIFFSAASRASTAATSGAPIVSSQSAPTSSGRSVKIFFSSQAASIDSGGGRGAKRPSPDSLA